MKKTNNLKRGLIWYLVTLVIYGILLYNFREWDVLSTFYHILLFFPLILVLLKKETLQGLGFRRGVYDTSSIFIILLFALIAAYSIWKYGATIQISYSFFLVALIAPITEEIYFRGFLQEKITPLFKHSLIAILLAAILFWLIHLPCLSIGMYSLAEFGFIFVLGGLFGWVYYDGKTLVYPILLHIAYNLVAVFFHGV